MSGVLSRRRRKSVWGALALLLALSVGWALRPAPVPVQTARIELGNLAATVSGDGRTRVRDLYVLASPVDGQLERIRIQIGDVVRSGEPVALLRPLAARPLDARTRAEANAAVVAAQRAVQRAEALEREARAALEHAQAQLGTARDLARGGALPQNELTHSGHAAEIQRSALEAATAAANQARAELVRARAVLGAGGDPGEAIALPAPTSGKVLRVLRESAGPIAAGTPLLEIGDLQRLEVEVDLLSSDAAQVHEGARASVSGWGGSPLDARVRRIAPGAFTKVSALGLEEQRVHVLLDFTAPVPPQLGHAYRVDASVVIWEGQEVLRAPAPALFRAGNSWAVFRVAGGRAQLVPVELGATDGSWTVIRSGLSAGDELITQPSDLIEDGTRVTAR